MASTVVLADSAANWSAIGAIGQCVAAICARAVAVVALRWDHQQRCDREKAQAALVIIKVEYSTGVYGDNNDLMAVTITNHSDQAVHRPLIQSMGDVRPPARWGWDQLCLVDEDGDEYVLGTDEVLLPHTSTRVPHQQGRLGPHMDNFFNDRRILAAHRKHRTGSGPPADSNPGITSTGGAVRFRLDQPNPPARTTPPGLVSTTQDYPTSPERNANCIDAFISSVDCPGLSFLDCGSFLPGSLSRT
jgi:hypothetical protein